MTEETSLASTVGLATQLTIAWLNNPNNRANADEVPAFLQRMHQTLNGLASAPDQQDEEVVEGSAEYLPAVSVRKSLASPDHIISMIDGKPYKTLRRHLSRHGMTPEQYRERYKLKPDYPMVAKNYSEQRRAMAHKIGLGARGRGGAAPAAPASASRNTKRTPRKTSTPAPSE